MNLLLFVTVTAIFVILIVSVHFRFFGWIKWMSLRQKFDFVPWAEILLVVVYGYWAFSFLFAGWIIYPYLIAGFTTLVFAVPLVLLLRDFIPGLTYRTNADLKQGVQVEINNVKAEIEKVGYLCIVLNSENGNSIIIPYSKIRSSSFQGSKIQQDADSYCYNFEFDDLKTARDSMAVISNIVLTSPWLPAGTNPAIRLIEMQGQKTSVEVRLQAISPAHARLIEQKINSRIQKK